MYQPFIFTDYHDDNRYDLFIAPIETSASSALGFIASILKGINAPAYCGHNWNAIDEVLGVLDWIDQRNVEFRHDGVPNIDDINLLTHIGVINDMVRCWQHKVEHSIRVTFPLHCKARVLELLDRLKDQKANANAGLAP